MTAGVKSVAGGGIGNQRNRREAWRDMKKW